MRARGIPQSGRFDRAFRNLVQTSLNSCSLFDSFRLRFLHADEHILSCTRLRLSPTVSDDSLILVENPVSLIIHAIQTLFTVELNFSELDASPYWTTLLIFDLALEAWDIETKSPLPRLPLSHVDFANILSTRQLQSLRQLVERRLEEIDTRLERFHHWNPHLVAREDEQLKLEIARNLFARLLELLSVRLHRLTSPGTILNNLDCRLL